MNYELNGNHFDYIFTSMKDAVCILDRRGVLIYANPSARTLFNLDDKTEDEQKIWKSIPYVETNDGLIQLFIDCTAQKLEHHEEFVDYEDNEGKISHLRVSMTCTDADSGEQVYIAIISDLTEFIRVHSAFERYTSRDIADYVLNGPGGEGLGGRERECTILMSDLRGFTALSTKLSPSDLITVLNHYFDQMGRIIQHYQGTVIEFIGDGIFVVFGAPKEDPLHASHALCCAVEMENAMTEVNAWNKENGFPELEMGIGINSGPVIVGNIGSAQKMKYGCMGENVNFAGRVEALAIGGQIYASERTVRLIHDPIDISGESSFMPKGAKEPMKIYEVQGFGDLHLISSLEAGSDWEEMKSSQEVTFHILDGKTVGGKGYTGTLCAISQNLRFAMLKTERRLSEKQNIMLSIPGGLYAKVLGYENGSYRICFTSKPEHFGEWVQSLFR